jgi:hypothetical protein
MRRVIGIAIVVAIGAAWVLLCEWLERKAGE